MRTCPGELLGAYTLKEAAIPRISLLVVQRISGCSLLERGVQKLTALVSRGFIMQFQKVSFA